MHKSSNPDYTLNVVSVRLVFVKHWRGESVMRFRVRRVEILQSSDPQITPDLYIL